MLLLLWHADTDRRGTSYGTLIFLKREPVTSAPHIRQQEFELLTLVVAGLIERRFHLNTQHELREIASVVEMSEDAIFTETLDRIILTWKQGRGKDVWLHGQGGGRQTRKQNVSQR